MNAETVSGYQPLHYAAHSGKSLELVQLLVKKGANINARNKDGKRPIDLARQNRRDDIAKWLASQEKTRHPAA